MRGAFRVTHDNLEAFELHGEKANSRRSWPASLVGSLDCKKDGVEGGGDHAFARLRALGDAALSSSEPSRNLQPVRGSGGDETGALELVVGGGRAAPWTASVV